MFHTGLRKRSSEHRSQSFSGKPELFLKFSWSRSWSWCLIQQLLLRTLSEMHHPPLFAKHTKKLSSLNWLTEPTTVNYELWRNNSAQWCIELSSPHACSHLGIAPRLFTQVSSSLLAVSEIKVSFSATALRLSYLKRQFFSHAFMEPTCAFQKHWNLFWNDVHAVYLSLLQNISLTFAKISYSFSQKRQLSSKIATVKVIAERR